jgi:PAS domain S-box-containing protein
MTEQTKKKKRIPDDPDWMYRELFQSVPYNAAIIDRDFNIIEANDNFAEYFGNWRGKKCYQVYKNLEQPCSNCNAILTFQDGETRVSDEAGVDQNGRPAHYVVHIAPLKKRKNSPIKYIIELSSDVTEVKKWQREYQILFDRVPCYITIIDKNFKIIRANESFRRNFGEVRGRQCYEVYKKRKTKCPNCPAAKTFKDGMVHRSNQVGIKKEGEKTYYIVTTSSLGRPNEETNQVIEISTDVTELKKLEEEIIDAERLAAVGQTVAGLAHSIKNILMGLRGGMFIVSQGLKKDEKDLIEEGWEMLERNFEKTTSLVKDFLSFSKGRLPEVEMVNSNDLVEEIVDLYKTIAGELNVELKPELDPDMIQMPLDPQGIHTCLTNLVSNAIDACQLSEQRQSVVTIRTSYDKGILKFEVQDNGSGMDYDVKQKVFTTFFTTKGGKGTGLGLLTTRKIVQEHGGRITVDSKKGKGTVFRMSFPRKRLISIFQDNGKRRSDDKGN